MTPIRKERDKQKDIHINRKLKDSLQYNKIKKKHLGHWIVNFFTKMRKTIIIPSEWIILLFDPTKMQSEKNWTSKAFTTKLTIKHC